MGKAKHCDALYSEDGGPRSALHTNIIIVVFYLNVKTYTFYNKTSLNFQSTHIYANGIGMCRGDWFLTKNRIVATQNYNNERRM